MSLCSRVGCCVALLLLLTAAAARAGEWPQFGGTPDRNMVSPEKNLPTWFAPGEKEADGSGIDMSTTRNVRWAVKLGSESYSNPTVAGGRLYVGTNDFGLTDPRRAASEGGLLKCVDLASGRLLWQLVVPRFMTDDPLFNFDNLNSGICSSPTVEGDRVYVVSNRCEVLCLDVHGRAGDAGGTGDADVVWRFDMIKQLPCWPQDAAAGAPLVVGDLVYVCTANGVDKTSVHVPYPDCPSLIALDKHTGKLAAFDTAGIGHRVFHGQWSSPTLGEVNGRKLVFYGGGDGVCYAFAALSRAGEKPMPLETVWSCDCNPPHFRQRDGQPIPYINGDIRRHLGNTGDGSYVGPCEIIATPVFHENRVYVAIGQDPEHGRGRGMLTCIDATGRGDITAGGKRWTYDRIDRSLSSVAIAGGLLYVADIAGNLHCLEVATGGPYWVYPTRTETWGSPLVADGRIYLGTKKGLMIFAEGPTARLLNQVRLGSPVWCTPVAADGVLYVSSQRYLWAVQSLTSAPAADTSPAASPATPSRQQPFRSRLAW